MLRFPAGITWLVCGRKDKYGGEFTCNDGESFRITVGESYG